MKPIARRAGFPARRDAELEATSRRRPVTFSFGRALRRSTREPRRSRSAATRRSVRAIIAARRAMLPSRTPHARRACRPDRVRLPRTRFDAPRYARHDSRRVIHCDTRRRARVVTQCVTPSLAAAGDAGPSAQASARARTCACRPACALTRAHACALSRGRPRVRTRAGARAGAGPRAPAGVRACAPTRALPRAYAHDARRQYAGAGAPRGAGVPRARAPRSVRDGMAPELLARFFPGNVLPRRTTHNRNGRKRAGQVRRRKRGRKKPVTNRPPARLTSDTETEAGRFGSQRREAIPSNESAAQPTNHRTEGKRIEPSEQRRCA